MCFKGREYLLLISRQFRLTTRCDTDVSRARVFPYICATGDQRSRESNCFIRVSLVDEEITSSRDISTVRAGCEPPRLTRAIFGIVVSVIVISMSLIFILNPRAQFAIVPESATRSINDTK